jgi:branched-chain amino acid transport system ATP-binding protein
MALLEMEDVVAGYGEVQILRAISLSVVEGTLVSLIGANGAGKTTLARAATGLLRAWSGRIVFDGTDVTSLSAHRRAALGLIMVPEGRELFAGMTVGENLEMGAVTARARPSYRTNLDRVFELFPILQPRRSQRAGTMSGGEQQMLAIARGLMGNPRLLIIDELSLGLAPKLVTQLLRVSLDLKHDGQSILLTEQNVRKALAVSDYTYVMAEGRIDLEGLPDDISGREEVQRAFLGM